MLIWIGFIVLSYLCGSMPFGYWLAKVFKGKHFDIRDWGSGNIGFTNVKAVLGWKVGIPVLLLDLAKGFVPTMICKMYIGEIPAAFCMIAAGIGHGFSFYFFLAEGMFSGGKMVATLCGGALALNYKVALSAFGIWLVVLFSTGYMSMASMLAALSTPVFAYIFQASPAILGVFLAVPIAVIRMHARNVVRLRNGTEPKFSEKRGVHNVGDEVVAAFAMHNRDLNDLKQLPGGKLVIKALEGKKISERFVRMLLRLCPVMECGEITGIVTKDGRKVRVILLGIIQIPEMIKEVSYNKSLYALLETAAILVRGCDKVITAITKGNQGMEHVLRRISQAQEKLKKSSHNRLLYALLKAAAVLAQRLGATVLGLGGLLSSEARGGKDLDLWCKKRGLTIQIDNGAANTVSATLIALKKVLGDRQLSDLVMAALGARGLIGHRLYDTVARETKESIAFLRGNSSRSDRQINIGTVLSSDDLSALSLADIVFCCTSSPEPLITAENCHLLKEGCYLLDVAYPPDVADKILELRPDVTLIRCGLMKLPGNISCPIDFHFGQDQGVPLFPACLVEAIILALTQAYEHASLAADVTEDDVDFYTEACKRFGFEVVARKHNEQQLYQGEADAE